MTAPASETEEVSWTTVTAEKLANHLDHFLDCIEMQTIPHAGRHGPDRGRPLFSIFKADAGDGSRSRRPKPLPPLSESTPISASAFSLPPPRVSKVGNEAHPIHTAPDNARARGTPRSPSTAVAPMRLSPPPRPVLSGLIAEASSTASPSSLTVNAQAQQAAQSRSQGVAEAQIKAKAPQTETKDEAQDPDTAYALSLLQPRLPTKPKPVQPVLNRRVEQRPGTLANPLPTKESSIKPLNSTLTARKMEEPIEVGDVVQIKCVDLDTVVSPILPIAYR